MLDPVEQAIVEGVDARLQRQRREHDLAPLCAQLPHVLEVLATSNRRPSHGGGGGGLRHECTNV